MSTGRPCSRSRGIDARRQHCISLRRQRLSAVRLGDAYGAPLKRVQPRHLSRPEDQMRCDSIEGSLKNGVKHGWARCVRPRSVDGFGLIPESLLCHDGHLFTGSIPMGSASRSWRSSSRCRHCHTPAACQSCSRRQQVTPDPHPISAGSISHGMPVRSTSRMPVNAAHDGTGGRPPWVWVTTVADPAANVAFRLRHRRRKPIG